MSVQHLALLAEDIAEKRAQNKALVAEIERLRMENAELKAQRPADAPASEGRGRA